MRLLGIDFETTWTTPVNPHIARITEVGAVLFEWETKQPLELYSQMIHDEDIPPSPPELVELTGITDTMREEFGAKKDTVLCQLATLISKADYVFAHNGNDFDKIILLAELERRNLICTQPLWIDTKTDVPYPKSTKSLSLKNLAADHRYVNYFAHRAIFDVFATFHVLSHYDINQVIALANEATVYAIANVSYQQKHLAQARQYMWNPEEKYWYKAMKESKAEAEVQGAGFPVQIRRKNV